MNFNYKFTQIYLKFTIVMKTFWLQKNDINIHQGFKGQLNNYAT